MSPIFTARIHVEEAEPADIHRIADIHERTFAHAWGPEEFSALIRGGGALCLVLREAGPFGGRRIAGFILARTAADEAEILTIAVDPNRQGRGYGRVLVEEAMRRLFRDHVSALFLEVDESNQPALRLYRSLGFEEVGRRPGYYREKDVPARSALVMRVQLR